MRLKRLVYPIAFLVLILYISCAGDKSTDSKRNDLGSIQVNSFYFENAEVVVTVCFVTNLDGTEPSPLERRSLAKYFDGDTLLWSHSMLDSSAVLLFCGKPQGVYLVTASYSRNSPGFERDRIGIPVQGVKIKADSTAVLRMGFYDQPHYPYPVDWSEEYAPLKGCE